MALIPAINAPDIPKTASKVSQSQNWTPIWSGPLGPDGVRLLI
jgi:hypothetical protein